jgi:hypothetical protein
MLSTEIPFTEGEAIHHWQHWACVLSTALCYHFSFSLSGFKYIGGVLLKIEFFSVISFAAFSSVGILFDFDKRLIFTCTCGTSLVNPYTAFFYTLLILLFS